MYTIFSTEPNVGISQDLVLLILHINVFSIIWRESITQIISYTLELKIQQSNMKSRIFETKTDNIVSFGFY